MLTPIRRMGLQVFPIVLTSLCLGSPDSLLAADPIRLSSHPGLKAFDYTPSTDVLPNYVAGAKWGTQTDPIRTMQKPVSAEESIQHLVMPPEFEAHLFASEPDVLKPICMAWDERGRLWIAETIDYPNEMQKPGEGRDRIKVCEDTNGDGKADRFTIFADKLSIPTSLVFARGGVIVSQAPDMLFLKDTDGDGKADVRETLFTGWGTGDTHAGPSNLRWGFDNWIWGTVGYSGFEGIVGGKKHKFGMGIFRFKPDGTVLEFMRSSNNNTWGLGWSEDGTVFGSTANGNASMYMPMPNRFYEQVDGVSASRLESIADSQAFYPLSDKVRQVDWHGKYTAGAGHALYTARSFPSTYWNRISFVCEPTGHLIGFFELEASGADFTAHNRGSFLGSDDEWTAPIAAEVGPDGALWMLDLYNYIVQHNPTPHGFKLGKGNAYETQLRDKRHGRIYRIVHTRSEPSRPAAFPTADPAQWVAALKNDNLLWRLHAQRLLVDRGGKDVAPALRELVKDRSLDRIGLNPGAVHGLWTLHGLGAIEAAEPVLSALKHPSAAVRRAAVQVLPRNEAAVASVLKQELLYDKDAQVRLAALLALAEMPPSDEAGMLVQAMLQSRSNADDRWIRDAAMSAGARHLTGFMKATTAKAAGDLKPVVREVLKAIAGHQAGTRPADEWVTSVASLRGASPSVSLPLLEGWAARAPAGKSPVLTSDLQQQLQGLMKSLEVSGQVSLIHLAQRWGKESMFASIVSPISDLLSAQLTSSTVSDKERIQAAQGLVRIRDTAPTLRLLLDQVTLQASPTLSAGIISAAGESRSGEAGSVLLSAWKGFTAGGRRSVLGALLRRPEWTASLVDALEKGTLSRTDLGPEHWQQLKASPNSSLASRAAALQTGVPAISSDRAEVVKKLLPVATQTGNAARGKEVFTASCAVCHIFDHQGGKVGPELTGIGARDRTDILMEILDPNRSVEANYRMWTATTLEGDTIAGRLDTETQTAIDILDLTGQKHSLQRKELKSLEASDLSIMPVGFEALPEHDLASLLQYLTQPSAH